MSKKDKINIIFTRHANSRLADREITKTQVRLVLMNPTQIIQGNEPGKFECFGLPRNPPYLDSTFLVVIYAQTGTNIKVITSMWQDRAGLIANGFNRI